MTFKTYLLIGGLIFFYSAVSYAQIRLPIFDVELKINENLLPGDGRYNGDIKFMETTNIYGGAHVQIGQHIALGGFYSRSFRGVAAISYGNGNTDKKAEVLLLQKGLDLRLSTGRAKKWRKFLSVNYSQLEIVQVNQAYRLGGKTNAYGASLGIMRKLSNNLYLNVIELGVKVMSDEMFWLGPKNKFIMDARMGLIYNIGKKK